MIPVEKLSSIMLPVESKETHVEIIENIEHMEIEEAKRMFGFQYDMNSIEKKVELFIKPTVAFDSNSLISEEIHDLVNDWLNSMDFQDIYEMEDSDFMARMSGQHEMLWDFYKTRLLIKTKEEHINESLNEDKPNIILRTK